MHETPNITNNRTARGPEGGPERHAPDRGAAADPRLVTRGESLVTPDPFTPSNSAITDWLNCSFPMPTYPEAMEHFFFMIGNILGENFTKPVERGHGHNGWRRSFILGNSKAIFAVGGQNGKAFLSLPAYACTLIGNENWPKLVSFLDEVLFAKITRWDGAVDDHQGVHSVDWAVEQYKNNEFSTGGNKATCTQFGNWLEEDGRGRTFVVGRRKNGKMIRIYEKGKQLGKPLSPWVRWELELHNRDRFIPWDVIANPGHYVAGAYDATSWINDRTCRIKTAKTTTRIAYDASVDSARNSYGPLINVMLSIEGSAENVVEKLIRDGTPKRLDIPVPPELVALKAANGKSGK